MKRDSARDILREVKIATEGSLARGEYQSFTNFAKKQKEIGEIQAFSFYGKTGTIELSSDSSRINQSIPPELWQKAETTNEMFLDESNNMFSFYYPLHVDADMRRLHPTWKVGELYGVLCLDFSKDKLNEMSAAARAEYTASSWRASRVVVGAVGRGIDYGFWHCTVHLPRDSSPAPRLHGRRQGTDRRRLQRSVQSRRRR